MVSVFQTKVATFIQTSRFRGSLTINITNSTYETEKSAIFTVVITAQRGFFECS